MKENNTLEATLVACARQIKDQKAAKAKRIVVGTDVHLRVYQGNSLLLSQGFGSCKHWWRPKALNRLEQLLPGWLFEMLQTWVDLLRALDEKIQRAKAALTKRWSGPRPKGAGANSLVQLGSEVLNWDRYAAANGRHAHFGRQLIVDLWRLQTGRASAQQLNLVMIGG